MQKERSNTRLIIKSAVDENRSPSPENVVSLPNLSSVSPLNVRRNLIVKASENRDHLQADEKN